MVSFIILFTSLGGSIGSMSTAYIFQKNLGNYYLLFATIPLILILIFSIFFQLKKKLQIISNKKLMKLDDSKNKMTLQELIDTIILSIIYL
jgi:ATP-dependent Zn protease